MHGLSRLDSKPILRFESQKAKQLAAKEDKERRDKERSETTAPDEPDAPVETRRTGRTGIPARERRLIIRTAHKPEAQKTAERTTGLA